MRRRLTHPIASLILLALLLADAWFLPIAVPAGGYSSAGGFLHYRLLHQRGDVYPPPSRMVLVPDASSQGGFRSTLPDAESYDEATRMLAVNADEAIVINWSPSTIRTGLWAPTRVEQNEKLQISHGSRITPDQVAAARRLYVEACGAAGRLSRSDFRVFAERDLARSGPLWVGYLHNTAAAAALVLFLISLAWVPRTPAYVRSRITAHRLSRGLCPRCRYNLHGLPASRCPECGQEVKLKAQSEKLKSETEPGSI